MAKATEIRFWDPDADEDEIIAAVQQYYNDAVTQDDLVPNILYADGLAHYPDAKVACDVLKSTAYYKDHIRYCIEPNAGGHYYVWGYNTTQYRKASATFDLSRCSTANITKDNRRAFMSLSIIGPNKIKQCDIGIAYDAEVGAWYPHIYSDGLEAGLAKPPVLFEVSGEKVYGSGSPYTKKTCHKFGANDVVRLDYLVGTDENGKDYIYAMFWVSGTLVADIKITGDAGTIWNETPEFRFVRFMSLVPLSNSGDDDYDDLSALYGEMTNLYLYDANNKAYAWNSSRIEHAWVMQPENVPIAKICNIRSSASAGATSDNAQIYHTVNTHP
jgi:hypothetical protein